MVSVPSSPWQALCWLGRAVSRRMRRVHVLGGGSLGSLFASHFAKATVPTTLLLRPEAARLAGPNCTISVTAEDSDGVDKQTLPCEPADGTVKQPFDILVVAVKAFDARPALEAVGTRVASSSTVILMCNGALAVADDLAHVLGDASLLCATTTHGAWSRGPQDLHHAGKGGTWIGALPKAGTAASGGGTGHSPFGDSERSNKCERPLSPHAVGAQELFASCGLGALVEGPADTERRLWPELTRTPRGLRRVRTGYAYQPPALVRTGRTGRLAPRAPRTVRTGYAYQPRPYRTHRVPWQPRS